MREETKDASEMTNQVLFGETFTVLDQKDNWINIKLHHDNYEGWIDIKQCSEITKKELDHLNSSPRYLLTDLVDIIHSENELDQMNIVLGSLIPHYTNNSLKINNNQFHLQGDVKLPNNKKEDLVKWAYYYLGTPYLWGGRSPFGIDCSGFTQMVYRLTGHHIPRDASQQALIGEALSFIEESEPGDLAFFDNEEGNITHVGILLNDNYIIHASGKVRLDRLDQSGIYNAEMRRHTHKLRVIKKIV